jgi:histone acetyltransferase
MELKLESNLYPTMAEFLYDANLIFQNCRQYNPENSTYVKNANKLERYMKERGASVRAVPTLVLPS